MAITEKLNELSKQGYEDITLSESNLVKLINCCSADCPLLIGGRKMWIHVDNNIENILVETGISFGIPVELKIDNPAAGESWTK